MEKRDAKHVAVIGAGLAGLAAARDLARAGYRVTVCEAAPDFGGLAGSFEIEGTLGGAVLSLYLPSRP